MSREQVWLADANLLDNHGIDDARPDSLLAGHMTWRERTDRARALFNLPDAPSRDPK